MTTTKAPAKVIAWTLSAPDYFAQPLRMKSKTAVIGMVRDLLENGVSITVTPVHADIPVLNLSPSAKT